MRPLDKGRDSFSKDGIGHPHHCRVGYLGVLQKSLLNLFGVDIEAATEHHVFLAIDDIET